MRNYVGKLGAVALTAMLAGCGPDTQNGVTREVIRTVPPSIAYSMPGIMCVFRGEDTDLIGCSYNTENGPKVGDSKFCYSECLPIREIYKGDL